MRQRHNGRRHRVLLVQTTATGITSYYAKFAGDAQYSESTSSTVNVHVNYIVENPVYTFDVAATDTHCSGTLIINLKQHTFVLNGQGFEPNKVYCLRYTVCGTLGTHQFRFVTANKAGNVHLECRWFRSLADLPALPVFTASTTASGVYAVLTSQNTQVGCSGSFRKPSCAMNWWWFGLGIVFLYRLLKRHLHMVPYSGAFETGFSTDSKS